jgi:CubicO group peptidase (beta-lactamase class C family)
VTAIAGFLAGEIEEGSFPGASALVGTRDAVLEETVAGRAVVEPEADRCDVTPETLFDLASLTKPLCSGALLARTGDLFLETRPGRFFPEWKKTRFEDITLERLLTHTSGLAAWFPMYVRGEGVAAYRRTLGELEPVAAPGERVIYSDLNFLLLTQMLEAIYAGPLDRVFAEQVAAPAGSAARFLPEPSAPAAATERGDRFERAMVEARGLSYGRFRDGVVRGEVHDGNAFRRGGVSGHAGVFATARDVWALARSWLDPAFREWTRDRTLECDEGRGLAWQSRRGAGSAIPEMSDASFGHTGFTGTSIWVDPERDRILVLLTNRIHPEVREIPFNEVRQRFHRVALEAFP